MLCQIVNPKIAVFGDYKVGKTTFINRFANTVLDKMTFQLFSWSFKPLAVQFHLKEFYDCNDPIIPDVIVIIFDLTDEKSFANVFNNWIPCNISTRRNITTLLS